MQLLLEDWMDGDCVSRKAEGAPITVPKNDHKTDTNEKGDTIVEEAQPPQKDQSLREKLNFTFFSAEAEKYVLKKI